MRQMSVKERIQSVVMTDLTDSKPELKANVVIEAALQSSL
jgi:hypothetical protein